MLFTRLLLAGLGLVLLPATGLAQGGLDAQMKAQVVAAAEYEILHQKLAGDGPTFLVSVTRLDVLKGGPHSAMVIHYRPKLNLAIRTMVALSPKIAVTNITTQVTGTIPLTKPETQIAEIVIRNTLFIKRVFRDALAEMQIEFKLSVLAKQRFAVALFKNKKGDYHSMTVKVDLQTWQVK